MTMAGQDISVSIIVPCRNERWFIRDFVESVFLQEPVGSAFELIIADGMSDDGTREILKECIAVHPDLVLLDNPDKTTPHALNCGIRAARGEIIVRMDVHTNYAQDYVSQCVHALRTTGAMCVGGPWVAEGNTPVQRAIAAAFQSPVGSGGAASRRAEFSGWVDTVYLGAWWRTDLLALGGFDETLVRNQDDELALRIHREGGKVWQSSQIRSVYVPRTSLALLYRQFSQYGYWKIPVIRKHKLPASPRHLAPLAFFTLLLILAAVMPYWATAGIVLLGLVLTYLSALIVGTRHQRAALHTGDPGWLTLVAVATMHVGYAVGFGRAIWEFLILRKGAWQIMTRLTR